MKSSGSIVVWGLALAIFIFGVAQGLSIAVRKPLWNDEVYSQVANVDGKSFGVIWRGGVVEGNNAPLFYSLQKGLCLVLNYHAGDLWHREDFPSRIILRVFPVIFMSLALALIFWYFSTLYSMAVGGGSFLLALSTYLVWAYWAEARPYAMIFFGTVIQAMVLHNALRLKDSLKPWKPVMLAHLFLALTTPISVIQVSASALMLWLAGYRKALPLLGMVGLPLAVAFGYHMMYPEQYAYWFAPHGQPLALITSAIPETRLEFLLAMPVVLWFLARKDKERVSRDVWLFQGWVWSTILGYALFLASLWVKQKPNVGFEVSNRYMMVLAPVGVAGVMVLFIEFIKRAKSFWPRLLVWACLLMLILPRLVKVFRWANTLN